MRTVVSPEGTRWGRAVSGGALALEPPRAHWIGPESCHEDGEKRGGSCVVFTAGSVQGSPGEWSVMVQRGVPSDVTLNTPHFLP